MRSQQLFIGGEWTDGVDEFEVHDPYDGELVARVAVASQAQAAQAVDVAKRAMAAGWSAADRADLLLAASRRVAERSEEFAELLRAEAGKPITAGSSPPSLRSTSRSTWCCTRSHRLWPPAAPWCSSLRSGHHCRLVCWPRRWPRSDCRPAG